MKRKTLSAFKSAWGGVSVHVCGQVHAEEKGRERTCREEKEGKRICGERGGGVGGEKGGGRRRQKGSGWRGGGGQRLGPPLLRALSRTDSSRLSLIVR